MNPWEMKANALIEEASRATTRIQEQLSLDSGCARLYHIGYLEATVKQLCFEIDQKNLVPDIDGLMVEPPF